MGKGFEKLKTILGKCEYLNLNETRIKQMFVSNEVDAAFGYLAKCISVVTHEEYMVVLQK